MTGPLRVFVVGNPAPQGSKKYVGGGRMIESSKKLAPWRDTIAWQTRASADGRHFTGPVELEVDFMLTRPKSAPKSRRWPDRKPDVDKLLRAVCDALVTAGVIEDDARVVSVRAQKLYAAPGEPTGAAIVITAALAEDVTRNDGKGAA